MANETILVTGATGQVGRRLVPRLLAWREPGDEVRVLVRTEAAAERFAEAGARTVIGDLTDADGRKRALDGANVVVNCAATFRDPDLTEQDMAAVNRDAAVALARAAAQADVRRFVQVSTNLVYGPGVGRPAREDDALRAGPGGYPGTKRECEEQLGQLRAETGFNLVTLRLPFVYGEGDPHIVNWLSRFGALPAHQQLPMVHHADVGQGVLRAIRTPGVDGRAYNIAGDGGCTAYELHELVGASMDPKAVAGRTVEDPWFGVVDTTRAHRELGFNPVYPTARSAWRAGAV
jgi:nucleoside-diphosphate-sugar epimerase